MPDPKQQTGGLWPNLGDTDIVTPGAVLKEMASLVTERTRGLIEGRVVSRNDGNEFMHRFIFNAPALDNYEYQVFFVRHPIELYPCLFVQEGGPAARPENAEALYNVVLATLNDESTLRVVRALLAQSKTGESFV